MTMNWHQRRHGWTCSDCGYFNESPSYNCDSEECEMEREREVNDYIRRGNIHRYRQEYLSRRELRRDQEEFYSYAGITLGTYRVRRYVGGRLVYIKVIPPLDGYPKELAFRVEWWRVPHSIVSQAWRRFGR